MKINLTKYIRENDREYKKRMEETKDEIKKAIENGDCTKFIIGYSKFPTEINLKINEYSILLRRDWYKVIPEDEKIEKFLNYCYHNMQPTPKSLEELINDEISVDEFKKQLPEEVKYYIATSSKSIEFWKEGNEIYYHYINKTKGKKYPKEKVKSLIKKWKLMSTSL